MIYKTKISPRVIWLESDLSNSTSRIRVKTSLKNTNGSSENTITENSCNATPYSNGYDSLTTYCYNTIILDNKYRRSAYVACDYVQ